MLQDCLKVLDELEKGVEPTEAFLKVSGDLRFVTRRAGCQNAPECLCIRAAQLTSMTRLYQATKIGVLVNKVGRQPEGDERVSRAAKTLVKEWKLRLHKDPSIDKKAIELAASAGLPSAGGSAVPPRRHELLS